MRVIASLAVWLLLTGTNAPGQVSTEPAHLLMPGGFQTRTRPELGNQEWFGVYATPTGHELRRTLVTVEDTPYGCGGSGRKISAQGSATPLFLVAGLPGLKAGPIDTAFEGRRFVHPGESIPLKLNEGGWYTLEGFGTARPGVGGVDFREYQVVLRIGDHRQILQTYPRVNVDAPPRLLWAGDIDRDNRVDLLQGHDVYHYVLFLSSIAKPGDLVAQAAIFRSHSC